MPRCSLGAPGRRHAQAVTPSPRAFLAGVYAADNSIIRDAATDRDDMSDILTGFLAAELTGWPDALAALPERLLSDGTGKPARKRYPGGAGVRRRHSRRAFLHVKPGMRQFRR
jgi:hypothetical protein